MEKILNRKDEQEFLKKYVPEKYDSPSVTADMLIFTMAERHKNYRELPDKELQILLIERNGYPYKGCWAIPGGFADMNENLDATAERELLEETGLSGVYMEQLYTWGEVQRDPRKRVISVSYMALAPKESLANVRAGDDAKSAKFFSVELVPKGKYDATTEEYQLNLRNEEIALGASIRSTKTVVGTCIREKVEVLASDLAFDHAEMIYYAIKRLRNKAEYTTIAFNLLKEEFTIGELQQVYSTILNEPLLAPNFRRKMLPLLEETGKTIYENMGHRPARLYRLKAIRFDGRDYGVSCLEETASAFS